MLKRIFVAIGVPESLKKSISSWQIEHHNLAVRWVQPKNLHITLLPPWEETDPENIINILETFEASCKAFELELTSIAFGPTANAPSLIWASGKTPQALLQLRENVKTSLESN